MSRSGNGDTPGPDGAPSGVVERLESLAGQLGMTVEDVLTQLDTSVGGGAPVLTLE
ncbi:MAG: hypothetical protein ACI9K2_006374, partial [Myxococcota bacterium]